MRAGRLAVAMALALALGGWGWLRAADEDVARGNRHYAAGRYQAAVDAYRAALAADGRSSRIRYDLGTALYQLAEEAREPARTGLLAQAEAALRQAAGQAATGQAATGQAATDHDRQLGALVSYNLGNVLFRQERYRDAVEAYKRALRHNLGNDQARYNLELAYRMIARTSPPVLPPGPSGDPSGRGQEQSPDRSRGGQRGSSGAPGHGQAGGQGVLGGLGQAGDSPPQPDGAGTGDGQAAAPGLSLPGRGLAGGQTHDLEGATEPAGPGAPEASQSPGPGHSGSPPPERRPGEEQPGGVAGSRAEPDKDQRARDAQAQGERWRSMERKLDALERRSRDLWRDKWRRAARAGNPDWRAGSPDW